MSITQFCPNCGKGSLDIMVCKDADGKTIYDGYCPKCNWSGHLPEKIKPRILTCDICKEKFRYDKGKVEGIVYYDLRDRKEHLRCNGHLPKPAFPKPGVKYYD